MANITRYWLIYKNFAQKKCSNHKKKVASSICLHEDYWKSESDQGFFCRDYIINHKAQVHGNSIRCNALFTNELFDELDEFETDLNDKLEEKVEEFEKKTDELYAEVEQWIKCQFSELKNFIESRLRQAIPTQINQYSKVVKNLKKLINQARLDISIDYENRKVVKSYFTQIKKIKMMLSNEKAQNYWEFDIKFQQMVNEIKNNVKNQVNRFMKGFICE